jgi:hypothetical protein
MIGTFYIGPPDNWDVIEYCGFRILHPIAVGDVCDPMRFPDPQCEPGAACYSNGGGAGNCLQWCLTDSDCSNPGAECSVELLHWFRYDVFDPEFPYILCSR